MGKTVGGSHGRSVSDTVGRHRVWSVLETGPVNVAIGPGRNRLPKIFQYLKAIQTCKFKSNAFPMSKNIQTCHDASFEYGEQLPPLAQLQFPT
jgi:hypothetical protein